MSANDAMIVNGTRGYLIAFLSAMENALRPPRGAHHSLTVAHFGSDEAGYESRLVLTIAGQNRIVFIDEGDLEKPVDTLVGECLAILANQPMRRTG